MKEYRIVDRGDGPKIDGTRITVYFIYEFLDQGYTRDEIAGELDLSSGQVQAALEYIERHEAEVKRVFEQIMARIQRGNPPWVEERLKANRAKLRKRMEELAAGKAKCQE